MCETSIHPHTTRAERILDSLSKCEDMMYVGALIYPHTTRAESMSNSLSRWEGKRATTNCSVIGYGDHAIQCRGSIAVPVVCNFSRQAYKDTPTCSKDSRGVYLAPSDVCTYVLRHLEVSGLTRHSRMCAFTSPP